MGTSRQGTSELPFLLSNLSLTLFLARRRTIILSSGFDEEIGGSRSAGPLARELESRYGKDGIALIVDEGFTGVDTAYGETFARFGMAEKGAVSLSLEVLSEGGHSSVPHGATGIGNLARLLVALEDHPDSPKLEKGNPILQELACGVEHGEVDKRTRKQLRDPKQWKKLGEELAKDDILRAFLSTTQATDLVQGGVKLCVLYSSPVSSLPFAVTPCFPLFILFFLPPVSTALLLVHLSRSSMRRDTRTDSLGLQQCPAGVCLRLNQLPHLLPLLRQRHPRAHLLDPLSRRRLPLPLLHLRLVRLPLERNEQGCPPFDSWGQPDRTGAVDAG